jgi:hypothetical protein
VLIDIYSRKEARKEKRTGNFFKKNLLHAILYNQGISFSEMRENISKMDLPLQTRRE